MEEFLNEGLENIQQIKSMNYCSEIEEVLDKYEIF